PRLKIILDAANLFQKGMAKRENVRSVISRGVDLLGPWIVLAHGKDIKEGSGLDFTGPGQGIIDFEFFLNELSRAGYKDGIILHGIKNENDMGFCVDHVRKIAVSLIDDTMHP
ncbi:MAG: sugar phosphate isomerase/epimerase, partial [Treponema sp.]|nr:sugar phosphate isomerase/epimerase [Treponema sp.]